MPEEQKERQRNALFMHRALEEHIASIEETRVAAEYSATSSSSSEECEEDEEQERQSAVEGIEEQMPILKEAREQVKQELFRPDEIRDAPMRLRAAIERKEQKGLDHTAQWSAYPHHM